MSAWSKASTEVLNAGIDAHIASSVYASDQHHESASRTWADASLAHSAIAANLIALRGQIEPTLFEAKMRAEQETANPSELALLRSLHVAVRGFSDGGTLGGAWLAVRSALLGLRNFEAGRNG